MVFEHDIKATTKAHFRVPRWPRAFGVLPYPPWNVYARVVGTKGELYIYNFVAAFAYHYITISTQGDDGKGTKRTEKVYGIAGWSTYVDYHCTQLSTSANVFFQLQVSA